MGLLSMGMFLGLWNYGKQTFGWSDPDGQVSMAIFVAYILGIIGGYRVHS